MHDYKLSKTPSLDFEIPTWMDRSCLFFPESEGFTSSWSWVKKQPRRKQTARDNKGREERKGLWWDSGCLLFPDSPGVASSWSWVKKPPRRRRHRKRQEEERGEWWDTMSWTSSSRAFCSFQTVRDWHVLSKETTYRKGDRRRTRRKTKKQQTKKRWGRRNTIAQKRQPYRHSGRSVAHFEQCQINSHSSPPIRQSIIQQHPLEHARCLKYLTSPERNKADNHTLPLHIKERSSSSLSTSKTIREQPTTSIRRYDPFPSFVFWKSQNNKPAKKKHKHIKIPS